jgi:glycosyltransferase involved in cell wall biosynthesis
MSKLASPPLVSVIMPVFNGAKYISEALSSIRDQHYLPLEILVIDDGSTDDTASCIKEFSRDIRYVYQPNKGPAAARNKGLSLARGELFAFLDADDLWPPDKLHRQVSFLLDNPTIQVVMGRIQCQWLPGGKPFDTGSTDGTMIGTYLGSGVFRSLAFDAVGPFDASLRFSEDRDWFFRAAEQNASIRVLPELTLLYRLHANNMTRDKDLTDFQYLALLKKSLDRRRALHNGSVPPIPDLSEYLGHTPSSHTRGSQDG